MDGSWPWLLPPVIWLAVVLIIRFTAGRPVRASDEVVVEPAPALIDHLLQARGSTANGIAATVHDLIGRRHLRLVPGEPGEPVCVLRDRGADQLQPWEQRLLGLSQGRELPGIGVPLVWLTSVDDRRALLAAFDREVSEAAASAGLERLRDSRLLSGVIVSGGMLSALVTAWGLGLPEGAFGAAMLVGLVAGVAGLWWIRAVRLTPQGRRVCGVLLRRRDQRRGQDGRPGTRDFAALIALGLIPADRQGVGPEPANVAWSPVTGRWQRLRVFPLTHGDWFKSGPPYRLTSVVVNRRLEIIPKSRGREERRHFLVLDDGRLGKALEGRCPPELYEQVRPGSRVEVRISLPERRITGGRVLDGGARM